MIHLLIPMIYAGLALAGQYDTAEIVFAGDAMMHQKQIDVAKRPSGVYDYSEYFDEVAPYISAADYAVVNLETPTAGAPYSGYPCFNAPESYIDALADAGFDMFLTANNHTLDRRDRGLKATIQALDRRELDHIGTYTDASDRAARLPFVKCIKGIKVGFINYTYGTNGIKPGSTVKVDYIDRNLIKSDVQAARDAGAEIIVACVHWGVEYTLVPHNTSVSLANYLDDLGVEVVIGGHPHVIQPMEFKTDGTPRFRVYSLGNFVSNMTKTDCRGGAMVKIKLSRDDSGKAYVDDVSYRLTFTKLAGSGHNFRVVWADDVNDAVANQFKANARAAYSKHNIGVAEELPNHNDKQTAKSKSSLTNKC